MIKHLPGEKWELRFRDSKNGLHTFCYIDSVVVKFNEIIDAVNGLEDRLKAVEQELKADVKEPAPPEPTIKPGYGFKQIDDKEISQLQLEMRKARVRLETYLLEEEIKKVRDRLATML